MERPEWGQCEDARAPMSAHRPRLVLPDGPVLAARHHRGALLFPDGELVVEEARDLRARLREGPPPIVCHLPATARRLGLGTFPAADILELYAFVRPAEPVVPSPRGLAEALGLAPPDGLEDEAVTLRDAAVALLRALGANRAAPLNREAAGLAALMGTAGWAWAAPVLAALGAPDAAPQPRALRVWERLPEWDETARPPPPSHHPVEPREARARLAQMLGIVAEDRPGQADFASAATAAFAPREQAGVPRVVLAEAGTGTGKTAAYLAPASLWAERNGAPVWISTYTRNLQRQVDAESARLWPEEAERRRQVVIRKGRENYLCLLNLEDATSAATRGGVAAVALGLMARWALATRDGDMGGGDLPGWLPELVGTAYTLGLADRRGECIHSACSHWRSCFIERTIRRARSARIVVANHALVMVQAAWGGLDETGLPYRYVFDEGHHLFDAADSVFAAALSGAETAELRRWLRGAEGGRSRARGLRRRVEDLVSDRPPLARALAAAVEAARALPDQGWLGRLAEPARPELGGMEPGAENAAEAFLRLVREQVMARSRDSESATRETEVRPMLPGLAEAAARLDAALARIEAPLKELREGLAARLDDEAETLESTIRQRIESVCRSLARRALDPLGAWRAMARAVAADSTETGGPGETFVDWLEIVSRSGHEVDVGMRRHWVDPTVPFARVVAEPAHGMLVTSATLRDSVGDDEARWQAAEETTGAIHLLAPPTRAAVPSPFDYAGQTRAFVVTDVARDDAAQVAAAYRVLFEAAGGGALGLFTAIARLREVHRRIAAPLEAAGITLLAQHVDAMDNATLVDVFRAEEDACLLGTDAMRDGVDVPGRSLRLIVFDRMPWPRPTILHRARRARFGGARPGQIDDRITRARLRQAFGRLIRKADDRGCFVLLDPRAPSRLLAGLPEGVAVQRAGLAEVAEAIRRFLAPG
jgi:ATP-dependent DNA helicase DinG